jgi:phosphatidylglycerol:prolipoprotein diacylglycerol transferase
MIVLPALDPVAVQIGPLPVRWYGLMYALGFLAAWWLGRIRARRPGALFDARAVDDLVTWLILGLVLGARVGYVLFYEPSHFLDRPLDMLAIWKGGMSFHGGALGVALVCWLFARRTKKTLLDVGDLITPLAPPGLCAGRIGNFVNGELFGRPTDLPWGMVFPQSGPLPRHPSQLYEALLEGVALFVILWVYSGKPRPRGAVTGLFLLLYGLFRFGVEFAREPDAQLGFVALGWLTMGQLLCLPMIALGGLLLWLARRPRPSGSSRNG